MISLISVSPAGCMYICEKRKPVTSLVFLLFLEIQTFGPPYLHTHTHTGRRRFIQSGDDTHARAQRNCVCTSGVCLYALDILSHFITEVDFNDTITHVCESTTTTRREPVRTEEEEATRRLNNAASIDIILCAVDLSQIWLYTRTDSHSPKCTISIVRMRVSWRN